MLQTLAGTANTTKIDMKINQTLAGTANTANFDIKINVLHEPVIYRLKTKSYDALCPQILSLELKNRTYHTMPLTFVSEKMVHWHDKSHNEMIFKPLVKWTPSQSCEIAYKGIYNRLLLIKCSI